MSTRQSTKHLHLKSILLCQWSIDHFQEYADKSKSDREASKPNAIEWWLAARHELTGSSAFDLILISLVYCSIRVYVCVRFKISRSIFSSRNAFAFSTSLTLCTTNWLNFPNPVTIISSFFLCGLPSGLTRPDDVMRVRSFQKKWKFFKHHWISFGDWCFSVCLMFIGHNCVSKFLAENSADFQWR